MRVILKSESKNLAFNLGFSRFLFFCWIYYFLADSKYLISWQYVPSEFWLNEGFAQYLLLSREHLPLGFIFLIWKISLVMSAIGFLTRASMLTALFCGAILIANAQSYGYLSHSYMPIFWGILCLSFSSAGDVFSIDSFLNKKFKNSLKSSEVDPTGSKYQWPILFMQILFCTVFFLAGLSKLKNGGLAWLSSENMTNNILRSWIWHWDLQRNYAGEISQFFIEHPLVSSAASFLALVAELFIPLVFFSKRVRWIILPLLFLMQQAIKYTILVRFDLYICLYIFWIEWDYLKTWFMKNGNFRLILSKFEKN